MEVRFYDNSTGEEVLHEHEWGEGLPRVGDILELQSGNTKKWVVEEVDWVFEDVAEGQKDDVPLKHAAVRLRGEQVIVDPHLRMCECGHAEDMHTPIRCTGHGSTCQCKGFELKAD